MGSIDYMEDVGSMEEMIEVLGFSLLSEIPSMLINIAIYVITALAIYTIAKRRGINKPWLAWIPIVNVWTLGCIADQYQYVANNQIKNRRKVLLGTSIATEVISILVLILLVVAMGDLFVNLMNDPYYEPDMAEASGMLAAIAGVLLLCIPLLVVGIVNVVFHFIALHEVYKSCDPSNATLYLVLSIFFSIVQPIFLMICRNKDEGMPSRVEQPQPVFEQPTWQPAPPPAEPWEQNQGE